VRAYLEIEQLRLGDRLTVVIDVDPDAARIKIPTLSVQPLVENAVRHGVSSNPGPGTVALRIRREGNSVRVEVEDTGPGFPAEANQGVGLDNVRQRLRLTYGDSSALDIKSTGSLTTVSFSVCES
jgi:LytS/YehU family sensor histidine kinase